MDKDRLDQHHHETNPTHAQTCTYKDTHPDPTTNAIDREATTDKVTQKT